MKLSRAVVALALLFVSACASAPPAPRLLPPTRPETGGLDLAAPLPFDSTLEKARLDNGVTYYVKAHKAPAGRAEIWLAVDAGSILEDEDQRGLAHFIEHMAFNGTRRFARQELVDYLESIGMQFGPDINASTSFDETVYTLRVPTDSPEILGRAFDILEDWAGGVTFDPEEVDKERGVIREEWRLGRGAAARIGDRQVPVLVQGSRYADRLPIGTLEVIENAPAATLERFYRQWYRPDRMAVIAVGDFDPVAVGAMIRERFGRLPAPPDREPRPLHTLPGHADTLVSVTTDPELTETEVVLYTKLPRQREDRLGDYRRWLAENLFDTIVNDRLYELAHTSDPPFLRAWAGTGDFVRTASVAEAGVAVRAGQVERGLEALLVELERVRRHGLTDGEVDRAKRVMKRSYEDAGAATEDHPSESLAGEYVRNFLEGEPIPGIAAERQLVAKFLPGLTRRDIEAAGAIAPGKGNRVLLASAPEADKDDLPAPASLLATLDRARNRTGIQPYIDWVADGPLIENEPTPGTIVERREVPALGAREWVLSNGARVLVKPTDFKTDEVLFRAVSPGGTSLAADEDFWSATFAGDLVAGAGVGNFAQIDVEKMLAGRVVAVRPYIDELEEGLGGGAKTADLELLFQLVHLRFTAPRLDPEAFLTYRDKVKPLLENRLREPETAFFERLGQVLSQGHPRRQPLTPEQLDKVDPRRAFAFYQERFADASSFRFLLVGSFSPEAIEPWVETYLASLPATRQEETWRDVGVRAPADPVQFEVRRGLEPKATVTLAIAAESPFSSDDAHDLRALASAFEIRLREVLREDLGAVYGVGVSAFLRKEPFEQYSLSIQFGCAPERVDALVGTVRAEAEALRQGQLEEGIVTKVREAEVRTRELALRSNRYWLGLLEDYSLDGTEPEDVADLPALAAKVSKERLLAAAAKYFNLERAVVGVLRPEV
jgi:zinc protease